MNVTVIMQSLAMALNIFRADLQIKYALSAVPVGNVIRGQLAKQSVRRFVCVAKIGPIGNQVDGAPQGNVRPALLFPWQ